MSDTADLVPDAPCDLCGAIVQSGRADSHLAARHGPRNHSGRFPADAVLTIGTGKTGYTTFRGSLDGDLERTAVLESLTSGRKITAVKKDVRWDGKTYHRYAGMGRFVIYTEITTGGNA